MIDFTNTNYLKNGNSRQKTVYQLIQRNNVLTRLEAFSPVLVGTIPINIDIDSSDLDIICYWDNKNHFINTLESQFAAEKQYELKNTVINGIETVISRFCIDQFDFEIFGQSIPVIQQAGYRHMIIEHELLKKFGETFRLKIVELKRQGIKTEPAFAQVLELSGNPYEELLKFGEDL